MHQERPDSCFQLLMLQLSYTYSSPVLTHYTCWIIIAMAESFSFLGTAKSNFEVLLNELWNNFLKSDVVIPNRNDEKIENVSGILICSKVKFIISQVNIWASHWTSADCMLVTGCSLIEIPKKYATKHSICHSCYFRPLKKLIHATFSKQTSCLGLPPWHLACSSLVFLKEN